MGEILVDLRDLRIKLDVDGVGDVLARGRNLDVGDAAFDVGDRVVAPTPGYPCYRNALQALGVEVVDEVVFAVERARLSRLEGRFLQLEEQGVLVRLALDVFPHTRARVEVGAIEGVPLLTFSTAPSMNLGRLASMTSLFPVASSTRRHSNGDVERTPTRA